MRRTILPPRYFSVPDFMVLLLLGTGIYGLVAIGSEWRAEFHPVTSIDLSVWALPRYAILSGVRGLVAYLISLWFTLVFGYAAAKSKTAERVLIPLLDILQSIPVLGFLPGLVLGLIAIFPKTNTGLELAAVIMIFTGQAWNMTFSYYSSLKSLPSDFNEASTVIGLGWLQRLFRVELPFSAVNLAWNSLMSMAGGWFFLSVCEAFTLGDKEYRLPGIGAYMAVAIHEGNGQAIAMGIVAMVVLILTMDFFLWRPIMAWVRRFRLEDVPGVESDEPLMGIMIRDSRIVRWMKLIYRRYFMQKLSAQAHRIDQGSRTLALSEPHLTQSVPMQVAQTMRDPLIGKAISISVLVLAIALVVWGSSKLVGILASVSVSTWIILARNTLWTLMRVFFALLISTVWAVPVGIWIGTSARRIRIAQPVIQVLASFPAPMLYPLALSVIFILGIDFNWGSMFLMLLGVQWYVLFNVLAGALRIPQELSYALSLMESSRWVRWKTLYLPSVFPALVTGWVTAAGGAWNASIVSEYVSYRGTVLKTGGLGATINAAAASGDFAVLAASLTMMVGVVLLLNRGVWGPIYRLAQTRFKLDL